MNPGGVGSPYGGNRMPAAEDRAGVKSPPAHVVAECSGGPLPKNITTSTITTTTTTTTSSSTTCARDVQPKLPGESSLGRSNLTPLNQLNGLLLSQFGLYSRVVEGSQTPSKDVIAPHLLPSPILNVGEGMGQQQQQQLSPVPCGSGAAVVPPPGSSTHFINPSSGFTTHFTNPLPDSSLYFTQPLPDPSSPCFTNKPTSGSSHFSTTSDPCTQFSNPTHSLPNVCGKRYDQLTVVTSVHTEVTENLSGTSMCGETGVPTGGDIGRPVPSPLAGVSGASSGTFPARNAVFPSPNSVKNSKGKRKISLEEMVSKLHKRVPSKNVVNCEISQEILPQKTASSLLCVTSSIPQMKSFESRQNLSNECDNSNTANVNNNNNARASTASPVKDTLQNRELNSECCEKSNRCENTGDVVRAAAESCSKSHANESKPAELTDVEKSKDNRTGSIKSADCPQEVTSSVPPVQEVESDSSRLQFSGDRESRTEGSGQSSGVIQFKNKDAQSEVLNTICLKGQNLTKEVISPEEGEPTSATSFMDRQSDVSTDKNNVRNEATDSNRVQVAAERCTARSPAESGCEGRSSIELMDSETRDSDIEVVFEKSGGSVIGTGLSKPAQEGIGCKLRKGAGDIGSTDDSIRKSAKNIEEIDLSKGDSDSNPSSSFLNTDSGLVQYLEPISDDENSLLCAPCPSSSGLSSVSGVQSSSNTPMFSDTPSDTSHGTLMVKISDAVAAILSDVSDDSLPNSPLASNSNSVDGFSSALQREKLSEKIDSICEKLDRDCAKDGSSKTTGLSDYLQNSDKPAEKSSTSEEIVGTGTSDASISKGNVEVLKKDGSCLLTQTLSSDSIRTVGDQTSVKVAESCKASPSEQTQVDSGDKISEVGEGKLSGSVCQPDSRTKPDDEPHLSEEISVVVELLHDDAKEMASVGTRKSDNTTSVAEESRLSEISSVTLNPSLSLPAIAPELTTHLPLGDDSINSSFQKSTTANDNHSCQNLTSGSQTLSSHVGNSNTPQSEREDKAAPMLTEFSPTFVQDTPSVIIHESEPLVDKCVEPNTQVHSVLQEGLSQDTGEKTTCDPSSGVKVGHPPAADDNKNTEVSRSDGVKHAGTVDLLDPPNDKTRIEVPASSEVVKPHNSIGTSETEDHKTSKDGGSLTSEPTDTEDRVTGQGKSDDWSSIKHNMNTQKGSSIVDSSNTSYESVGESVSICLSDNSSINLDKLTTNAAITFADKHDPISVSCSPVKEDPHSKKEILTTPVASDHTHSSNPKSGMSLRPEPGEVCADITSDERENAQVPHSENLSLLPVSDSRESSSLTPCLSLVAETLAQCDIPSMYTKSVEEEDSVACCTTSDNAFLPKTSTSIDAHSMLDSSVWCDAVNSQSSSKLLLEPSVENARRQSLETNVPDSVSTSVDPECPALNLNTAHVENVSDTLEAEDVKVETPATEVKTQVPEVVNVVKLLTSTVETPATETTVTEMESVTEADTPVSVIWTPTETETPASEDKTSVTEVKTKATEVEILSTKAKTLATEVEAPAIETPVAEVEALVAEIDTSTSKTETPIFETGMTVPHVEVNTTTEDEIPATEIPTPATDTEMPSTEAETPASEVKGSATEVEMVNDEALKPQSPEECALQLPDCDASESCQSQPGGEEATSSCAETTESILSSVVQGQSDLECSGENRVTSDMAHIATSTAADNTVTVESEPLESVTTRKCGMSTQDSEVEQVSAVNVNVPLSPVVGQDLSEALTNTAHVYSVSPVGEECKEEDQYSSSENTGAGSGLALETSTTSSTKGTDKSSEEKILMTDNTAQQKSVSGELMPNTDYEAASLVEDNCSNTKEKTMPSNDVEERSEISSEPVNGPKQQLPAVEICGISATEDKFSSHDAPDKEETVPVVVENQPTVKALTASSVSRDECTNNVTDSLPEGSLKSTQDITFSTSLDEDVHSLVKEINTELSNVGCMEVNPGTDSGVSEEIDTKIKSGVCEDKRTETILGACKEIIAKTDSQAHEEIITETDSGTCEEINTETGSGVCTEINTKTDSESCTEKNTESQYEACAGINSDTTDSGACEEINTPALEANECMDHLTPQDPHSVLQEPVTNLEQRKRDPTTQSSVTATDMLVCGGDEAATSTSDTPQITDSEAKSPKETLCLFSENGEDGVTSMAIVINNDYSQSSNGVEENTFQGVQEKEEREGMEKKDIGSVCPLCSVQITETLDSHVTSSHICSTFVHAKLTRTYQLHMIKRVKDMAETSVFENEDDYKDSIFVCRSCKFASKSIDAVRFHLNSHEDVYQVRKGNASCECNKKMYSFEFHKWLSLIHESNYYCYKCSYYFGCENGFLCHLQTVHFAEEHCKDCNADVTLENMIPHLDLHKPEEESKEDKQNASTTVVTRSSEEKLSLSFNIYDNSLNYLDGKDFRLSTAKKVVDPDFDRSYLNLPLRDDVDDAVVPEEAKLDPSKDISKYLKDKKAIKLPLADNGEIQRNFSFAMQMSLYKRMSHKGRRSASGGSSSSRSRREDDLFSVLGISTPRSRSSYKKENADNSGITSSRKCKAKPVLENMVEADTPVLTRTRSGMVPVTPKGELEDKPEKVGSRPVEVTSVVDGEWSKDHTYICCSCGAGYLHLADIMDHKWEMHPSVWCAHTMVQGQGAVPLSFCRQYQPPVGRPHVLPLPEIPKLDSPSTSTTTPDPATNERVCTSCHTTFSSDNSFHAHLVECGGLSLLSAMKKKSKKGFRFKRRKGQGVPNNRYGNSSQPSTPLKARNGDRSSGLNTPLNDRSAASGVHTCGVKRRLELAVGSIDNVELKNRLKAIISGSRASGGGGTSSNRRFVKMKLRKKVLENRKLRKTRQSDRVKEIASKEQQQQQVQEKKDEKKVDGKDEKNEPSNSQTALKNEEVKESTENVVGKDNTDATVPKPLKSKSNKDGKNKYTKKSKKKGETIKDSGNAESAVKDLNRTSEYKVSVLESKEKKTKDTSRKNTPQAEKKTKSIKKVNGVIDKGKKTNKKASSINSAITGQVSKKASGTVNTISAEVPEVPVPSEIVIPSVPVQKAVSKSHKAVQTVEIEGFKNVVTLGGSGKKGKMKKSKMVMPKSDLGLENQPTLMTKNVTKASAANKGKASTKKSIVDKAKLIKSEVTDSSTPDTMKDETKKNDTTPIILASESGELKSEKEEKDENDVQQDKEHLQKSKAATQAKGRKGKDAGSVKLKDISDPPNAEPSNSSTIMEAKQKKQQQYFSSSEESEEESEEDSEEDSEPEVIHNFRSGRRCGGRLGLRHKRKLINTRYSFRTCFSTKEKDDNDGGDEDNSKATTKVSKRKVNYTEGDDDEELSEEPLTAKRKRKVANYENQDDYTYVPNESSTDLDEDEISDRETSVTRESSTRLPVPGNRVKTRRFSSTEGSNTKDVPTGAPRKTKSCDTSSDSKKGEEAETKLCDTSSDSKKGEEVKPSVPVEETNVTTEDPSAAKVLVSEIENEDEVKTCTTVETKFMEDASKSNSKNVGHSKTKKHGKKVRLSKGKARTIPQTGTAADVNDKKPVLKKARTVTLLGRLVLNSVFQAQVDEVMGKSHRKRRSVRNPEDLISETEDEMENVAAESMSDHSKTPRVPEEEGNMIETLASQVEEKPAVNITEALSSSNSGNVEPNGGKSVLKKIKPCHKTQDVQIDNVEESVASESKDVPERDELALEVCSKENTENNVIISDKNEAHIKTEAEDEVSEEITDDMEVQQKVLSSKKKDQEEEEVDVTEDKSNKVKTVIEVEDDDDDDDDVPLAILACKNKRKESPATSIETPELKKKQKPPEKKQRLSVEEVKEEGEESVVSEDNPSHTEEDKAPAENHSKTWGSRKSEMNGNGSSASDTEGEALKTSCAVEVSSKILRGTTKTASKCDVDQRISSVDESTPCNMHVDDTHTPSSSKKKKKTKVETKQPNQQTDGNAGKSFRAKSSVSAPQIMPTLEPSELARPEDEATVNSCGGSVADASSSPQVTTVKGQRRRSLIEKLREIPLQMSSQIQTQDNQNPSQLQSAHMLDEKHTTVAVSKKKPAKPTQPRKCKSQEFPNVKVKSKDRESLPVSPPCDKNSISAVNAKDSFKMPEIFETQKNPPGKRKRAASLSSGVSPRAEDKVASPNKDQTSEPVVEKDIKPPKNSSESTKRRRSGNNSKEVDHCDVNELTCLDCGLGFGSVASLEDHQQDCVTIAFEMSLMQAEDHLYECPHCQVTFALKGTQRKHTISCRMGKYKKAQNRHDSKNLKKNYKNLPSLPSHITQPSSKSSATPDTPSRRSAVKGRSCSKENVAGEGDVNHTSPLRDNNFVQVLLSHNDKEMGVNEARLPENMKNMDYIPRVMSVNASSTPKTKKESQVNSRPVNGELKELLSPVNVDDNRWCSVCGCEVVDKDLFNKHRLIEQFSFCCQQPVVLEVCALITQYNLGTDTIRSLVSSGVVYQDSIALSFDATLNLPSNVSSAGNNSTNGNAAKVKEVITSPHCTWIFAMLETIAKRHQTAGTVSIRGTQQEVLRAVTLLEDILKEISESDSAIEKNKMLKSMRETFEAGTRN